MNCTYCGAVISNAAAFCPSCGAPISNEPNNQYQQNQQGPNYQQNPYQHDPNYTTVTSYKSRTVALLLCIFLGVIGVHRFYVGKVGTGILYLFTGGLFGIGALVDFILILSGSFKDNAGIPLIQW